MDVTVQWRVGRRAEDAGDVVVFVAVAEGEARAVTRLSRRELEERVAGLGEECPVYCREALRALSG